eukprot:gnl/MRDRNA2_/MRDRNA2_254987_c0_seq1.p1 gnl/MRDRNA2_/MRDRNA2_254987_c0~~gnl/MRDRNA2_/MRDRNA2_254987_c0_seq1.p1  ORF type:complete len:134 (+),score=23.28 gnl/MRDRNA2_/MRDRNA2_254987_c0_seq1:390-791(+)
MVVQLGDAYWVDNMDAMSESSLSKTDKVWPDVEGPIEDAGRCHVDEYAAIYTQSIPSEEMFSYEALTCGIKQIGDFGPEPKHPKNDVDLMVHSQACTTGGLMMHKSLIKARGGCIGSDTSGCFIWAEQHFVSG